MFRSTQRILQLGNVQCSRQTRWGRFDDVSKVRTHEVWKMCSENVWRLRSPGCGWMPGRYNKVRLVLIQICSESIAIGRHLVHSADKVRWLWCPQQSTDEWGLEDASGSSTRTPEITLKLDALKIYWSKPSRFRFLREYCNWETFNAQCKAGEVVMMTKATYVRMRFCRYIRKTYDETLAPTDRGCSENIIK